MKKVYLGAGLILVLLILLRIGISLGTHKSDQEQIQDALNESIEASKQGKPGGVLELIGNQISFNSEDASSQMGQLSQFIKNQKPDIAVEDPTAKVSGDDAQISSPVTMSISFLGRSKEIKLKQVLLIFRKEPATKFLVIPSQKWKLEQVHVPNFSPEQLGL